MWLFKRPISPNGQLCSVSYVLDMYVPWERSATGICLKLLSFSKFVTEFRRSTLLGSSQGWKAQEEKDHELFRLFLLPHLMQSLCWSRLHFVQKRTGGKESEISGRRLKAMQIQAFLSCTSDTQIYIPLSEDNLS